MRMAHTENKVLLLALLVAAALVLTTRDAAALLTSSYYDGSTFFDTDEGLVGRIDYAVYDTKLDDDYVDNGIEPPDPDLQYIYAYQVFSNPFVQQGDIAHFAVLDSSGNQISEAFINGTMAQDDLTEGIAPDPIISETQGVWKWTFDSGYIAQGEHSWFLVFSSTEDWTPGTYEIRGPDTVPVPIPEPAAVTLLALGAGAAITRKKKTNYVAEK